MARVLGGRRPAAGRCISRPGRRGGGRRGASRAPRGDKRAAPRGYLEGLPGAAGEGVVVEGVDGDADEARRGRDGLAGHGGGGHEVGEGRERRGGRAAGPGALGQGAVEDTRLVGVGEPGGEGLRRGGGAASLRCAAAAPAFFPALILRL